MKGSQFITGIITASIYNHYVLQSQQLSKVSIIAIMSLECISCQNPVGVHQQGLQCDDRSTYIYVRKVMALPLLPAAEISPTCH